MKTLAQILANTRVDPSTGCRIWLGGRSHGYGVVGWQGKTCLVHRVVWELLHGSPGSSCVLHTCDNEPCCEPTHLFLGTKLDNSKDCVAKGRRPCRGQAGGPKLTEAQVVEIRKLLAFGEQTQQRIARTYGVTEMTISDIFRGVTWKHVR